VSQTGLSATPASTPVAAKNPRGVFILSPPRSGSTLLRVMLAGHPDLFAPQELELLSFETLQERKAAFSGRDSFWLEGALRALMEVRGCDAEEARRLMEHYEKERFTTTQFYRLIQDAVAPRLLVDKTPSYALDVETLQRAEALFDAPFYIHLLRHPYGMIRSFEEAKLEQLYRVFLRSGHDFTGRELAELIWLISHQNILTFLTEVRALRQHRVAFEDLVNQPQRTLEGICRFLGLDVHRDMLEPYQDQKRRMTDGLYTASRMLGDVKFHQHRRIDATVADQWKASYTEDFLGDVTWALAEQLGYTREPSQSAPGVEARSALTPIRRLPRDGSVELPLSFAQQRLWFLDQLEPGLLAYNILKAIRLTGPLNVAALEESFGEILRRHEVLRGSFSTVEGRPALCIAPPSAFTLPVTDLRDRPQGERLAEVRRLATQCAQRPFDLSQRLLRAILFKLADADHVLVLTVHHIVFDGWSFDVLFRELTSFYETISTARPSRLPALPVQYGDFAHWQREWLQGETLDSELAYWKGQLAGELPVLELPTDRLRPAIQTFRGAKQFMTVTAPVSEALKTLSRQEGVTLFMTLLAAFKTLLYRYTGQEDIIVGSPTAGRTRPELERLIGFFANTLLLRTDLSGHPTFRELLARVRQVAVGAYAHQDLPFEKLVEALQPRRDMSHQPLFQLMFALQNMPRPSLELAGLTMSPLDVDSGTAMFDLTVAMVEREQGLVGVFEYNSDLFDHATIGRMMGHFAMVLESIARDPGRRITHVSLLTESERRQLLAEWNDTRAEYRRDACIHELFEAQAERRPQAIAVISEDQRLTYRELNRRANQLARRLRSLGVSRDVLVGIYTEPSVDTVVALLGTLKAGGAYVPLDPTFPRERLAFMVEDANISVLLTQQRLAGGLPIHQVPLVCLDTGKEMAQESGENPSWPASSENLAYVIYTSGSTGKPKGVQICHRAVVNFLESMRREPGLTEDDRLLSVTTLSFDIAALEVYLPLIVGAQVRLVSRSVAADGARLAEVLDRDATVMQATPATWRLLLEAGWRGNPRLKALCGGEALSRDLADQLVERTASLWNMYGPTETTIWSAVQRVEGGRSPVPIGRPIANTQLYVLDTHLQPLPVGVPGELHIGGAGLARGYLNRPEVTAERFIRDHLGAEPAARLYKTGDLARYRSDGTIEFLGRLDHQVKVRGFRVELGEIETVLKEHPRVREAIVVAREDRPDDTRLVAYLLASERSSPSINELRSFLADKLPEYMVPSAFVALEAFPLTPNGKVDRRALPAPDSLRPHLEAEYVAPQSHTERVIAGVWSAVLQMEKVGVHDNFFDVGGHSLLMAQVYSRLKQAFQRDLSMVELFQYPTIAALAAHLTGGENRRASFGQLRARVEKQREAIHRQQRRRQA
jgi:amino acid adenylation domain-containing protein